MKKLTHHAALNWKLAALLAATIGGCVHPQGPRVASDPDPSVKIPAEKEAVENHDLSVVPQLITDLQSDDQAIRMHAIHALRRLTGQTLGYRYYDSDDQRAVAVERWKQWHQHQSDNSAATMPTK